MRFGIMALIYAMSDIHGHLDILKSTLENVDLKENDNKLILLGDYIDRGDKSCETLYFIKELSEKFPNQVIPLLGNHEEMFLDDLDAMYPIGDISEIKKYITEDEYKTILSKVDKESEELLRHMIIYRYVTNLIKIKHKNLITWLKSLPYYHETENQIFVHAGINEEYGINWKLWTSEETFLWNYPPTKGKFYKDIISGHTHTSEISEDKSYHKVFWDGENHFYIDGATIISKNIPLLKYDTVKKRYYSFEKIIDEKGVVSFVEYEIN